MESKTYESRATPESGGRSALLPLPVKTARPLLAIDPAWVLTTGWTLGSGVTSWVVSLAAPRVRDRNQCPASLLAAGSTRSPARARVKRSRLATSDHRAARSFARHEFRRRAHSISRFRFSTVKTLPRVASNNFFISSRRTLKPRPPMQATTSKRGPRLFRDTPLAQGGQMLHASHLIFSPSRSHPP